MYLYEVGNANIWSSPYVRDQLLNAHLNPHSDAASRKPGTIRATVDWIFENQPDTGSIIDLGCGPGLYAQEFAARGWTVVGIDINESAINHAIEAGRSKGLAVHYLHQSYLDKIDTGTFDIATCIYCDFGALTDAQQKIFLQNVHKLLSPDGVLVFDVFGPGVSQTKTAGRSWERVSAKGFWSELPCYVLSECQHFEEEQVWGQKYIVISELGEPATYVLWDHYFTINKLESFLSEAGFAVIETKSDLVQENDFVSSDVLFVRARKI